MFKESYLSLGGSYQSRLSHGGSDQNRPSFTAALIEIFSLTAARITPPLKLSYCVHMSGYQCLIINGDMFYFIVYVWLSMLICLIGSFMSVDSVWLVIHLVRVTSLSSS